MNKKMKRRVSTAARVMVLCIFSLICLAPFYVAICYAFKSKSEFAKTRLAFPTSVYLENFRSAFALKNYFNSVKNSVIVAAFVVFFIVFICSMSAYIIIRKNNRVYNFIFYVFQMVILIPFQTIMFPLYKEISSMHALNTIWGQIFTEIGVYMGYYVFLYTGFIKGVPIALEEAASIDGCNRFQIFYKIVFPLLKPITMTVIVLCFLASWNDFFLPMIMCQKETARTLPLMQFYFFGEYSNEINMAFAAALIAMIPTVIVYFLAQKYIVEGMTAGAVKS
ncbi:carbohydrate ABC transporter permease [Butyrivibrio sp. XPD2002]|uniref:carbohydrate ABC transporter permease n=1 Tax=Butyrivibrio sp. XPD2002 TaxID=1280665 RepID=UPI00040B7E45|nr:carbohydrate ABC transporter permease [Butyrivibrio sp. XPD2002]